MKQIPYLHLKIVYHLFYSINLELKLDGLEFNSQNIWFILLFWNVATLAVLDLKHFLLTWRRALHSSCGVYIIKYLNCNKLFFSTFSWILGFWQLCARPAIQPPLKITMPDRTWGYSYPGKRPGNTQQNYFCLSFQCFYFFFPFQSFFFRQDWKFWVSSFPSFWINSFLRSSLPLDALRNGKNHSAAQTENEEKPGVHHQEGETTPYSCHGVFADRSIFSLNLPRTRTP